jgi:hypothetical protein
MAGYHKPLTATSAGPEGIPVRRRADGAVLWTPELDGLLRSLWSEGPGHAAERMGLTYKSVNARADQLKLPRPSRRADGKVVPAPRGMPLADKFAAWVYRDGKGCHPWIGPRATLGKRGVRVGILNHKPFLQAHRYAYAAAFGPIPDRQYVVQRCGNHLCCNPAHLILSASSRPTKANQTAPAIVGKPARLVAHLLATSGPTTAEVIAAVLVMKAPQVRAVMAGGWFELAGDAWRLTEAGVAAVRAAFPRLEVVPQVEREGAACG